MTFCRVTFILSSKHACLLKRFFKKTKWEAPEHWYISLKTLWMSPLLKGIFLTQQKTKVSFILTPASVLTCLIWRRILRNCQQGTSKSYTVCFHAGLFCDRNSVIHLCTPHLWHNSRAFILVQWMQLNADWMSVLNKTLDSQRDIHDVWISKLPFSPKLLPKGGTAFIIAWFLWSSRDKKLFHYLDLTPLLWKIWVLTLNWKQPPWKIPLIWYKLGLTSTSWRLCILALEHHLPLSTLRTWIW